MTGQADMWPAKPLPEHARRSPTFGGSTFSPKLDGERLGSQLERVRELMLDGSWRTLARIVRETGGSEASVSARLRDLRKPQFGEMKVERRRVPGGNGLWEYRIGGE